MSLRPDKRVDVIWSSTSGKISRVIAEDTEVLEVSKDVPIGTDGLYVTVLIGEKDCVRFFSAPPYGTYRLKQR